MFFAVDRGTVPERSSRLWPRAALSLIAVGVAALVWLALVGNPGPMIGTAALASAILVLAGLLVLTLHTREQVAALAEAATQDPLTRLFNRRGFQQAFDRELDRAARDGTRLGLIIADLDDFKRVNDRLGHMGGDMALERAASAIRRSIRTMDTVARLGGEEFAILVPGTRPSDAQMLGERIRERVEAAFQGTAAQVTLSAGVAVFPDHAGSAEELFGTADGAMYEAKALGKNRCVIAHPEDDQPNGDQPERTQVSFAPPPWEELTIKEPSSRATRLSAAGATESPREKIRRST